MMVDFLIAKMQFNDHTTTLNNPQNSKRETQGTKNKEYTIHAKRAFLRAWP
jgi:hypothetical protein